MRDFHGTRTAFSHENMRHPLMGGDFDRALERYVRFFRHIGARDGRVLRQVHGVEVLCGNDAPNTPVLPTIVGAGDAVWVDRRGLWVGVYTADCLPILVEAEDRVMAIHAGWRGLAAGIIERAIDSFGRTPRQVTLGPCAGACCYCVGDDVRAAFSAGGVSPVFRGRKLDLVATARTALAAAGARNVVLSDRHGCTICSRRFHSYRRDGARNGLNIAAVALLDAV